MTAHGNSNVDLIAFRGGGASSNGDGPEGFPPLTTVPNLIVSDLFGGTWDLGTLGEAFTQHSIFGSLVYFNLFLAIDANATFGNHGPILIRSENLPVPILGSLPTPFGGSYARPGAFGFISDIATNEGKMSVPVLTSTGGILFASVPNAGGLTGLVSDSGPVPLAGIQSVLQCTFLGVLDA